MPDTILDAIFKNLVQPAVSESTSRPVNLDTNPLSQFFSSLDVEKATGNFPTSVQKQTPQLPLNQNIKSVSTTPDGGSKVDFHDDTALLQALSPVEQLSPKPTAPPSQGVASQPLNKVPVPTPQDNSGGGLFDFLGNLFKPGDAGTAVQLGQLAQALNPNPRSTSFGLGQFAANRGQAELFSNLLDQLTGQAVGGGEGGTSPF